MNSVQNVKDTFYTVLRDRIAAGNPGRTTVIRGTVRPALLVAENELPGGVASIAVNDAYSLHWTSFRAEGDGLLKLGCELHYATEGTTGAGGMDRGRALAAMDAELANALGLVPQAADGISVAEIDGVATATPTGTRIFWTGAAFGPAVIRGARMERTAALEVFGYE